MIRNLSNSIVSSVAISFALFSLFAIGPAPAHASSPLSDQGFNQAANRGDVQIAETTADDFKVVDCLLPGQIRRLGSMTYVSRRRGIKTTPSDCGIRGGEFTSYDRANYQTALKVWLPMAEAGDAKAQAYVGEIYEKGLGIAPDYQQAAGWYQKAANQDYKPAQQNLGHLYEKGLGVPRDPVRAVQWYRRAAGLPENSSILQLPKNDQTSELRSMRETLQRRNRELDEMQERLKRLQGSLAKERKKQKEIEVTQKSLQQQKNQNLKQLGVVNRELLKAGGKNLEIELLSPVIRTTRGDPIVKLRKGIERQPVIGRVRFASMVPDVYVNGQKQKITRKGVFRAEVEIPTANTPVAISAVGINKDKAELRFSFEATNDPSSGRIITRELEKDRDGKYYALVIGNNNNRYMPLLETAITDAKEITNVLAKKYGFNVSTLIDATRNEILEAISNLRKKLKPSDSLLIYYAGHGELDKINDRGHWLPVDAQKDNRSSWISNVDISDHLNLFQAKHILIVADSCYSGALTISSIPNTRDALSVADRVNFIKSVSDKRSRTALTSGGLTPVLDSVGGKHSIFATAMLDVLEKNNAPLQALQLFQNIFANVAFTASRFGYEQEPSYAPIRYAGHSGGDFLFLPKTE